MKAPRRLPLPCLFRGCPALVDRRFSRYCPDHKSEVYKHATRRRDVSPELQAAHAFYKSPEWMAFKEEHKRQEPWCRKCKQLGDEVDHIIQIIHGGPPLDHNNAQTLCIPCHARKSQQESMAVRRPAYYPKQPTE